MASGRDVSPHHRDDHGDHPRRRVRRRSRLRRPVRVRVRSRPDAGRPRQAPGHGLKRRPEEGRLVALPEPGTHASSSLVPVASSSPSPGESRGLLHPRAAQARFHLARRPPSITLAPLVEHYWIVTWDLRGQQPHQQRVLPGPSVQMTFTPWFSLVAGVIKKQFRCQLQDAGRILGVQFRPGGFRPFLGAPVAAITGTFLGIHEVFGPDGHALVRAVRAAADADGTGEEELVALVDRFLCAVAPKWVSRRCRLQQAAQRAAGGEEIAWVRLAADLGYSDQAHFTRDFTAAVGTSPTRYARACAPAEQPLPAAAPPGETR